MSSIDMLHSAHQFGAGAQATAISGPTVFVGRACPGDPDVPAGDPNSYDIAVVERGLCFFTEKLAIVEAAGGWDAVLIMNWEVADACKANLVPDVASTLPVVFIPRDASYALFGQFYDQYAWQRTGTHPDRHDRCHREHN